MNWFEKNRERLLLKQKEYYHQNKKQRKEYQINYYKENRTIILDKYKYYYDYSDKRPLQRRICYENNKQLRLEMEQEKPKEKSKPLEKSKPKEKSKEKYLRRKKSKETVRLETSYPIVDNEFVIDW